MVKDFRVRRLILFLSAIGVSGSAMAAGFQLWEQDAASMGNYHAGFAASANDASTAYYNPAGLVRISNQEIIAGGIAILPNSRFSGTVATNTLPNPGPQAASVQGGEYGFTPFVHYAAPITDNIVFGLSFTRPFGFQTVYGSNTVVRYVSVLNRFDVYDLSPSLGVGFDNGLSLGFGLDFQRLTGHFQNEITAIGQTADTLATSSGNDHAYGYHVGMLFQESDKARFGVTYISHVVHKLAGSSSIAGPLGTQSSPLLTSRIILPSSWNGSIFYQMTRMDLMANVSYINWAGSNGIVLNNVMGVQSGAVVNNLQSVITTGYQNSWNYSAGLNYHVTDQFMIRTGLGYDQRAIKNGTATIQLPDTDQIAAAVGAHFQARETLGIDVGWVHLFAMNTSLDNVSQAVGSQTTVTNGTVRGNTDIYGLQVKWDIL